MREWMVFALMAALLYAVAFGVRRTRSGWMIAGYNTSSPAEKARWNLPALKRGLSWLLFALATLTLAMAALLWADAIRAKDSWLYGAVFVAVALGGVLYINLSKRFRA